MIDWKGWLRRLSGSRPPEPAPPPSAGEAPAIRADEADSPKPAPDVQAGPAASETAAGETPTAATAAPVSEASAPAGAPTPRELELEREIRSLRAELRRLELEAAQERPIRERLEQEIKGLADYDPLTGLATARRFNDRLAMAIVHAQRSKQKIAIVQLGLDRFTAVTRALGRSHAEDLLRSVSLALEGALRQADTIARLGADDVFTVLLAGIKRDSDVMVVAEKLQLALRSPFNLGGHDLLVTASLGIALFPDDGPDSESLLQSANVALGRARERGGDAWEVHAPRSRALAAERQAREAALRRALARDELELQWRPVVDCDSGGIVGMESRLQLREAGDPERAAALVSLAEESTLAVPLGQWALRAACRQGSLWRQAGHRELTIGVSVSVRQLSHAALLKLVRAVLDETGMVPERLALGRFGTGESRLANLYRYPADTLKIDGSVVRGAVNSRQDEALVSAAISLARARRLSVVADGVESEAHRVLLARWQCDRMLGPLIGSAMSAVEAERLLERQRRSAPPPIAARNGPER
jgi:diguanylate cyclase (GGDEF)-like protein